MHLPKENFGFFPMSQLMLPGEVQAQLAREFEIIDRRVGLTVQEAAAGVRRTVAAAGAASGPSSKSDRRVSHADIYRLEDARLQAILRTPPAAPPATHVVVNRGQRGGSRTR